MPRSSDRIGRDINFPRDCHVPVKDDGKVKPKQITHRHDISSKKEEFGLDRHYESRGYWHRNNAHRGHRRLTSTVYDRVRRSPSKHTHRRGHDVGYNKAYSIKNGERSTGRYHEERYRSQRDRRSPYKSVGRRKNQSRYSRKRSQDHTRGREKNRQRKYGSDQNSHRKRRSINTSMLSNPTQKQHNNPSESRKNDRDESHFNWQDYSELKGRYKIMGLFGDGTFGRVIRCIDKQQNVEVAVKVIRAVDRYLSAAEIEHKILRDLPRLSGYGKKSCPRESRIVTFYDKFTLPSRHLCLVFEKLGPSLYDVLYKNHQQGFFMEDIQKIAYQILQSLSFLCRIRLTHTDLKPENILFETNQEGQSCYLPRSNHRVRCVRMKRADIKIIDFGSATFEDQYHSSIINTRQYRAPEVILRLGWDMSTDMWSFGCILMELYTGELLFRTHQHMEHLALIEKIVKPLPNWMLEEARRGEGRKYIYPTENRLYWPERSSSSSSYRKVKRSEYILDLVKSVHLPFARFVQYILEPDPKKRPTPAEALGHEFFRIKIPEE